MNNLDKKLKNRLRVALREQSEKTPRNIKIGDTYVCDEGLYDLMKRYLGLCGTKAQEK